MNTVQDGQCGLCKHFGSDNSAPQLVQIRTSHEAPADLTADCGNPRNQPLQLKVTAISGCAGFESAA